jgi:GT2 family glycosyltransferase
VERLSQADAHAAAAALCQACPMGKPLPPIAVVIPSWNCADDLRACLASLEAQQRVDLEIMVVDNGSTDGSVDLLRRQGIAHIPLPGNVGFARAINWGIAATDSPLVLPLNADTVLAPTAVAGLAEAMATQPDLGGVQPRLLSLVRGETRDPDDPEALIYSLGQALTADGRALEEGIGLPQGERSINPSEIFGVCGAACMFRRELLDQMGGYDERYFAFYEDVDLNVRARIAGWSFHLVPSAVVWHVGNAAWQAGFERPDAENARLVARNRLWTQVKFMPLRSLPRIALVEFGSIFRAIRARRFRSTLAGKLSAVLMLPAMVRDRRSLRDRGDMELARRWLGGAG